MELVDRIESLGAPATGALVLGAGNLRRGTVLLEGGRVCWAASRGMTRRLSDLLFEAGHATRDEIEAVFRRCRRRGVPLGEALVDEGIVDADGLSDALARHSAEALHSLAAGTRSAWRWIPHRKRTYDPRFTFPMADLLVQVGELQHPGDAERGREVLDGLGAMGAVAYADLGSFSFPVAATAEGLRLGGTGVQLLSSSALDVLSSMRAACGLTQLISWRTGKGLHVGVWRQEGLLFAAAGLRPSAFARLLSRWES